MGLHAKNETIVSIHILFSHVVPDRSIGFLVGQAKCLMYKCLMSYKIGEIGHVVFFGAQEYDNSLTLKKNLLFFYKTTVNHWVLESHVSSCSTAPN